MCRSDISPAARGPLGTLLGDLLIGPVDFGDETLKDGHPSTRGL